MSGVQSELEAIRRFYPAMEVWPEGGQQLPYLPHLQIQSSAGLIAVDALLYPYQHGGYTTRLFFDKQINAPGVNNWTAHPLCGRQWWTWSWNNVPATLPWLQILANHLRAFP
jgi:hypothetical protein